MYGYPQRIQTRADVELLMGYLGTDWATDETKQRGINDLQGLVDHQQRYVFGRILTESEQPDGDEPAYIVLVDDEASERRQYELQDDPHALIVRLGYSVAEVQQLITDIQETMQ